MNAKQTAKNIYDMIHRDLGDSFNKWQEINNIKLTDIIPMVLEISSDGNLTTEQKREIAKKIISNSKSICAIVPKSEELESENLPLPLPDDPPFIPEKSNLSKRDISDLLETKSIEFGLSLNESDINNITDEIFTKNLNQVETIREIYSILRDYLYYEEIENKKIIQSETNKFLSDVSEIYQRQSNEIHQTITGLQVAMEVATSKFKRSNQSFIKSVREHIQNKKNNSATTGD